MANMPEKLINYRVYKDGSDLLGTADVTLPTMESMTETIKGAGIAGEIDSPALGHFKSMETELNWRTISKANIALSAQKAVDLDIRGAEQVYDSTEGVYKTVPVKLFIRGIPKSLEIGKFDPATTTDTKTTLETVYLKVEIDGDVQVELDKINYICKIGDTDYLKDVREALGLA